MGITQDPLSGWYNTRVSLTLQSVPKTQESMITSEVSSLLSNGTIKVGPREQGIVYISLPDIQEKWGKP